MSVSYRITNKKSGVTTTHMHAACFAQHYGKLNDYSSVDVLIKKKWLNEKKDYDYKGWGGQPDQKILGWSAFTPDDYVEYVRLLQVMGLKVSMKEEDKQFVFTVPLSPERLVADKVALNAVRYLTEDPYPGIASWFLKFAKEKVFGVNLYTKFVLAHYYIYIYHGGHTFMPSYTLPKILKNSEVKKSILENTDNKMVTIILPQYKTPCQRAGGVHNDCRDDLADVFISPDVSFKKVYNKYKELCAKYM